MIQDSHTWRSLKCCIILAIPLSLPVRGAESVDVQSPDGHLAARFHLVEGVPQWQLVENELGPLRTVTIDQSTQKETGTIVWGKFVEYNDHFNQLRWTLSPGNNHGNRDVASMAEDRLIRHVLE